MELFIILILILLNGIFSMSEIALVSAKRFKLEAKAKKGSVNAKKALQLSENPNTFLSTVQIGITLIGILTGIYSGDKITENVKAAIETIAFLKPYAQSVSVTIVLIVLTFFSIVLGELIPKRIGLMFPEKVAILVAQPMTLVSIITKPFIWLLTKTNNLILGLFGLKNDTDEIVSEEEIKAMVQESAESGEIQEIEHNIVHRVFALGDRKVSELMTHRSDLIYLEVTDTLDMVKEKALTEPHSVYPVVEGSFDKILGIVSVKDIFPNSNDTTQFQLRNFLKQPVFMHGGTPAYKVLEKFKEAKLHYGLVVDEYGTIEGMISMDDIVDALVGDSTEYNQLEYEITERQDGSWLIDGQYPYFELLHFFKLEPLNEKGNFNTIAGLLLHELNHIPQPGEKVKWQNMVLEVVDMDGPKIDKILIRIQKEKGFD